MIEQITANDFVDVKDIKGMFLYTKSNKIFSYLRIYPFNLDLLTTEDRRNLTNRLAAAFDGDRKNFMYCTLPRELDLDGYKKMCIRDRSTGRRTPCGHSPHRCRRKWSSLHSYPVPRVRDLPYVPGKSHSFSHECSLPFRYRRCCPVSLPPVPGRSLSGRRQTCLLYTSRCV